MRATVLSSLMFAGLACATTFTVTRTSDHNGACSASGCSLREAILAANSDSTATAANPHIINIPAGHYILTLQGVNEDAGLTGDLDILNHMVLLGAGSDSTIIDGGRTDNADSRGIHERVFDVPYTNCPAVGRCSFSTIDGRNLTISMQGLTIQGGGGTRGFSGGAIRNAGSTLNISQCVLQNLNSNPAGGGPVVIVENDVTTSFPSHINITDSTITGSGPSNSIGLYIGLEGGVPTQLSTLALSRSTISNVNTGLAVYFATGTVINSTITGTVAGVINTGQLRVSQSTFLDNSGFDVVTFDYPDSLPASYSEMLIVKDSILGSGQPCYSSAPSVAPILSFGNNLYASTTSTCPLTSLDRVVDRSKLILGSLASNGGPTRTFALKPGSTAIDTGSCTDTYGNIVTTDQRGTPRPQDGNGNGTFLCDVGAYETVTPPTTAGLVTFYNTNIQSGALAGVGNSATQARNNQATFLGYLTSADQYVHNADYPSACTVLRTALQASDGSSSVRDLIQNGNSTMALSELNAMIAAVRAGLGC